MGSGAHQHRASHRVRAFALAAVSISFSVKTTRAGFLARKRRVFRQLQIEFGEVFRGQVVHPDLKRLLVRRRFFAHLAMQWNYQLAYVFHYARRIGPGGVGDQGLAAALMAVGAIENNIRFVPDIHVVLLWMKTFANSMIPLRRQRLSK